MANLKRKQRTDLTDEINWCTLYIRNLSLPLYVIRFGYTSKHLAHMHYMEIISKHLEDEELVEQFKAWKVTARATEFWLARNNDASVNESTGRNKPSIKKDLADARGRKGARFGPTFESFADHFGLTDKHSTGSTIKPALRNSDRRFKDYVFQNICDSLRYLEDVSFPNSSDDTDDGPPLKKTKKTKKNKKA